MIRGKLGLVTGGLLLIVCLCGMVLASSYTLADDSVVDQINITVSESCTLSGVGMDSHNAELLNNEYSADTGSIYENGIGKTTMTAFCNDYNGFSIYAIGFTGDSYDSANHTKLVGTADNTNTISTGVYSSGDITSSWAMKITKVTDGTVAYIPANMSIQNSFNNWHVVPATYTKVAQYHANTGSSATDTVLGGKIESTYAVYVSASQIADTYTGKVKYTLVHPYTEEPLQPQPSTAGCINYHANASSAMGTMGCQSATDNASVTLLASNFSRTGYGFAGWSDKFDYATNSEAKFYGPQETITAPVGTTANGLSLYAVWVKSEGNLQDTSKVTSLCGTNGIGGSLIAAPTDGTANLSSVSALTDQRDNNTYAIAKLADDKCWMIENLRLESAADHNSDGALAQGYGTSATYGNFGGLATAESTNFSNTTTANSLYYSGTQSGDATINIGTANNPGYRMPRYNNWNNQSTSANRPQNPTSNSATNSTTNAGMYSYGNYYTWHAAIADLTYNGTNNQSTTGTSLCPTGWHLPTGGSVTTSVNVTEAPSTWREFYNLGYGIMGSVANDSNAGTKAYYNNTTTNAAGKTATAAFRSFPNNFLYSGYFYTSSAYDRGSDGYYWSSTANSYYRSYYLRLNDFYVYPGTDYTYKNSGYSIRCIVSAGT